LRNRVPIAFVPALVWLLAGRSMGTAAADDDCNGGGVDIATDRPDVTNSAVVMCRGSLQIESGMNWTARHDTAVIDGPNSRVRLGVAPDTEVLVDLPDYFLRARGPGAAGFGDLSPAVKRQLGPLPGDIELSATAGLQLPTGAARIAGAGYGGYLQFPWSKEIGGGWGVSGMVTAFWIPGASQSNPTWEPTVVLEREVGSRADLFVEYVSDHPRRGVSSQIFNSGGAYRPTATQQIDFHVGIGLNHVAPDYFFGVGYSIRFDSLF
jgi:hypothetical protein